LCQWHKGIAKSIFNAVSENKKLKFATDNIALLLKDFNQIINNLKFTFLMSKFVEAVELYKSEMDKLGISYDETLLTAVVKGLGPSIYNADSSKVSSSDKTELDRVKSNFLIKKLGLSDSPALDEGIQSAVDQLGASNRNKYRAMFYYLLVKHFGKESIYG
jgi:hypothetical protein